MLLLIYTVLVTPSSRECHVLLLCRCSHAKCQCKSFFFIPAEGSWVLRCRCKHRHTDHDPQTHACCTCGCQCAMFHSPWVCNCNHAWSTHKQVIRICLSRNAVRHYAVYQPVLSLNSQQWRSSFLLYTKHFRVLLLAPVHCAVYCCRLHRPVFLTQRKQNHDC